MEDIWLVGLCEMSCLLLERVTFVNQIYSHTRVVLWVPCGLPAGGLWVHMPPAVTRVGAASNTPGRFNLSTLKYREQSLQGTPLRSNHHYYHYNHLAMLARLEG